MVRLFQVYHQWEPVQVQEGEDSIPLSETGAQRAPDSLTRQCGEAPPFQKRGPGANRVRILFRRGLIFIMLAALSGLSLTGYPLGAEERVRYAATIPPLSMILQEIVGERGEVYTIVPPGFSPVLFDPGPSDLRSLSGVRVLFSVSKRMDGWSARLPAASRVAVDSLIPEALRLPLPEEERGEGSFDPHFWTDPLLVNEMVPSLVERLCKADPEDCRNYYKRGEAFQKRNMALHQELVGMLAPLKGARVALFHPSLQYFLKRYGLVMAAVVEPFPGKEPGPRYLTNLIRKLRKERVVAVFTEPQLPAGPARVVAEAAQLRLGTLDPLGGGKHNSSYRELILHNARVLLKTLQGEGTDHP